MPLANESRQGREAPVMHLNASMTDLFAFKFEDFTLENYHPLHTIKAPIAV